MSPRGIDGSRDRELLLGSLVDRRVLDHEERELGRVADVELTKERPWRVRSLVLGRAGWIHRLRLADVLWTHLAEARKVEVVGWDRVQSWDAEVIRLRPPEPGQGDVVEERTPPRAREVPRREAEPAQDDA